MPTKDIDFTTVTELAGDEVTRQQVESAFHRYTWAARQCEGKDVLEVACGSGPGLGLIARSARSVRAGDLTPALVRRANAQYGNRIAIEQMNAEALPLPDASVDVVMLFEALYYLPHPVKFVAECIRVLRKGGKLLMTISNKDMADFTPSEFAHTYHGVVEVGELLAPFDFDAEYYGYWTYEGAPVWHRALVPVKKAVIAMGMMPKTMDRKKLFKRLVFGKLVRMPEELTPDLAAYSPPTPIPAGAADRTYRIIYCAATLR